jgi:DNA-binding sugar fermentation-stimulating protein
MSRTALIDLGVLARAVVVARPSKTIKSPYVADVVLLDEIKDEKRQGMFEVIRQLTSSLPTKKIDRDKHVAELHAFLSSLSPNLHLAHAPSLDCAGMAVPGSIVYLSPASSTQAKTTFTIQLCAEQRQDKDVIVGYHPSLAERALKALMEQSSSDFLSRSLGIRGSEEAVLSSQQTFGDSRFDFVLETPTRLILIECKNVVGADYASGTVPSSRSPIGVYCVEPSLPRSAIFPHGSGSKLPGGVISDRAIKHVDGLIKLNQTKLGNKVIESAIVFLVNRSDCSSFRPCHEADKLFAQMLHKAKQAGVRIIAQEIVWSEGRVCYAGRELPVTFDASVSGEDIDPELLQEVLTYNSEHSNDRKSPSSSAKKKKTKSLTG